MALTGVHLRMNFLESGAAAKKPFQGAHRHPSVVKCNCSVSKSLGTLSIDSLRRLLKGPRVLKPLNHHASGFPSSIPWADNFRVKLRRRRKGASNPLSLPGCASPRPAGILRYVQENFRLFVSSNE